ncbi:mycothiol transferase [Brachybacterium huguangmaarense]
MNGIDILSDLATRPRDLADSLRDRLTPEALNRHPGRHDNSIAWLLWHTARMMDMQLSALSGEETVWLAKGYDERFGLGLAPDDMGYGHTPEQARAIRVDDADLLLEHLRDVTAALLAYLGGIDDAALSDVVDEDWDPPVTRGARIVSILDDAAVHVGQAAYVLGMDASED